MEIDGRVFLVCHPAVLDQSLTQLLSYLVTNAGAFSPIDLVVRVPYYHILAFTLPTAL